MRTRYLSRIEIVQSVGSSKIKRPVLTLVAGITVEGDKDVLPGGYIAVKDRVGILGEIAAIDVPFTQKQYTEKTITDF